MTDALDQAVDWKSVDWKSWAEFLATYVDYHHGKGISDQAWDRFILGGSPYDD